MYVYIYIHVCSDMPFQVLNLIVWYQGCPFVLKILLFGWFFCSSHLADLPPFHWCSAPTTIRIMMCAPFVSCFAARFHQFFHGFSPGRDPGLCGWEAFVRWDVGAFLGCIWWIEHHRMLWQAMTLSRFRFRLMTWSRNHKTIYIYVCY